MAPSFKRNTKIAASLNAWQQLCIEDQCRISLLTVICASLPQEAAEAMPQLAPVWLCSSDLKERCKQTRSGKSWLRLTSSGEEAGAHTAAGRVVPSDPST
eukprot:145952-Pleurochrysis_carterae.AAC.3